MSDSSGINLLHQEAYNVSAGGSVPHFISHTHVIGQGPSAGAQPGYLVQDAYTVHDLDV